jgi:hypothetical protein
LDALALLISALLPWSAGTAVVLALRERSRAIEAPGEIAWLVGAGYLVGAFALAFWMRVMSLAGLPFGRIAIGAPLLLAASAGTWIAWRRDGRALLDVPRERLRAWIAAPGVPRVVRIAGWIVVATIALRFALLLLEVLWQPLYPWDAWTQWATKARVWFELGHQVPFVTADAWVAGDGAAYFDAAPTNPPTLPLLQVWTCVALGRWDDALMNLPWWLFAVALTLAVAGSLRRLGAPHAYALAGAYIVASIPLANAHVALAGYSDLPLAACYCTATLAFLHWHAMRHRSDALLALFLAVACTQLGAPGLAWTLTLVPGIVVAALPKLGFRIVGIAIGCTLFALAVLARTSPVVGGHALHLDFDPAWYSLGERVFLLGNWNLLWYGVIGAAAFAGRQLPSPALGPLTATFAAAMLLFLAMAGFPSLASALAGPTPTSRLLLQLAPLAAVFTVLAFLAFATRSSAPAAAAPPPTESAPGAA